MAKSSVVVEKLIRDVQEVTQRLEIIITEIKRHVDNMNAPPNPSWQVIKDFEILMGIYGKFQELVVREESSEFGRQALYQTMPDTEQQRLLLGVQLAFGEQIDTANVKLMRELTSTDLPLRDLPAAVSAYNSKCDDLTRFAKEQSQECLKRIETLQSHSSVTKKDAVQTIDSLGDAHRSVLRTYFDFLN